MVPTLPLISTITTLFYLYSNTFCSNQRSTRSLNFLLCFIHEYLPEKSSSNLSNVFFWHGIKCLIRGLFVLVFNLIFIRFWFCVVFVFVTRHLSVFHVLTHFITQVIIQVSMSGHKYSFECPLKPLRIAGIINEKTVCSPNGITRPGNQFWQLPLCEST